MELMVYPTWQSSQAPFKLSSVESYEKVSSYTITVKFENGREEKFYSIDRVDEIESKPNFKSHSHWYYIDNTGTIKDFIVHSGLSPSSAEILAGIYKVYPEWVQAKKALDKYNKVFTTFKV